MLASYADGTAIPAPVLAEFALATPDDAVADANVDDDEGALMPPILLPLLLLLLLLLLAFLTPSV